MQGRQEAEACCRAGWCARGCGGEGWMRRSVAGGRQNVSEPARR